MQSLGCLSVRNTAILFAGSTDHDLTSCMPSVHLLNLDADFVGCLSARSTNQTFCCVTKSTHTVSALITHRACGLPQYKKHKLFFLPCHLTTCTPFRHLLNALFQCRACGLPQCKKHKPSMLEMLQRECGASPDTGPLIKLYKVCFWMF